MEAFTILSIGQKLIHFYNLKKTVPPYLTIQNFKFQTRTQDQVENKGPDEWQAPKIHHVYTTFELKK